jgi:hypothetical protein
MDYISMANPAREEVPFPVTAESTYAFWNLGRPGGGPW